MKLKCHSSIVAAVVSSSGLLIAAPDARQAFDGARWLWPTELGQVTNTMVEFRQVFTAPGPASLTMSVAADTVYAVKLNGELVRTGRFPDVPPQRYFDVMGIGNAHAGENELIVGLYVQGANSFQTVPGDPGVMFGVSGDGVRIRSGTGTTWRVSARDRSVGVPMVTSQLGFSFEYDALAEDLPWRPVGRSDARRDVGDFVLSPRPVPQVEMRPPAQASVVACGSLDGSPATEDFALGMDVAVLSPVGKSSFFASDGRSVRPELFERGFYVLVDLGREEAGFLSVDIDTDAGVVVDVGWAEHAENGRIRTAIGPRRFAGRYHSREGRQAYLRWARRMAGRYVMIHVRGVKTRFVLNELTVRPVEFPVGVKPVPEGLTALQRTIWDVAVRTLRLCMHEHYEDCPWREQALYANDARNQMLCGYYAFDDRNRMPELALTVLGRGVDDDGWQTMCMPARMDLVIPSFTFCWVLAVDDNLRFRGDPETVRRLMPPMRKILDTQLGKVQGGLLPCPTGRRYWQFYEWSDDMHGPVRVKPGELRFESPLNLFFVLALEAGARCALAVGDGAAAARWREAAGRLRQEICRRFWNEDGGFLEMRLGAHLRPSELTQSLALLADAVPATDRDRVVRKLMSESDWTRITVSQALYKCEALLAAGGEAAATVVRTVDAEWKRMLDAGATSFWEMREGWQAFDGAGSLCHGWSAVPIYIYGISRSEKDGESRDKRNAR